MLLSSKATWSEWLLSVPRNISVSRDVVVYLDVSRCVAAVASRVCSSVFGDDTSGAR